MSYKFGLIGTGNMGGALACAAAKVISGNEGLLANRTRSKAQELADVLGFSVGTNEEVAQSCKYVFLGVKPQMMADMLSSVQKPLAESKETPVLVSMAAGLTTSRIQEMAGGAYPVIRIMPNTPVSIGEGVILYSCSDNVTKEDLDAFLTMMDASGMLFPIDEKLIDVATAVSGCGPAFIYMMVDAMADGAVTCGLPRNTALQLAAQTFIGSAKMILESDKHPDALKNEVCSPGGSTIRGVHVLEQHAIRATLMDAVIASYEKSRDLGK